MARAYDRPFSDAQSPGGHALVMTGGNTVSDPADRPGARVFRVYRAVDVRAVDWPTAGSRASSTRGE
jgi:hypothetical protein